MLLALLLSAPSARAAMPVMPTESMCAVESSRFERIYGIPERLLQSISIVESGRWDDQRKATIAWPWTVMAEGNGKYFSSKAEAIAEVKRLKAAGVRNIDVGCMQVNLHYHPEAFPSLEDAFDPASNVAYAARFLKGLFGATDNWPKAASYYHSQTPNLAAAYRDNLLKVWERIGGTTELASLTAPTPSTPPHTTLNAPAPAKSAAILAAPRQPRSDPAIQYQPEERQIAEAYRQARLAEYQLRRTRMQEHRPPLTQVRS